MGLCLNDPWKVIQTQSEEWCVRSVVEQHTQPTPTAQIAAPTHKHTKDINVILILSELVSGIILHLNYCMSTEA